jgi:hypothetical protein
VTPLPPDRGPARLLYAGRDETPTHAPAAPARRRLQLGEGEDPDRVLHGDLLAAAGSLLADAAPRPRLAYLDPPFDTGRAWLARLHLRGPQHSRRRADLEVEAYTDRWTGDAYLGFLHARLRAARALLHPEGVLVLHCDARRAHHLRTLGEEVFGPDRLLNEVVWLRRPGRTNTGRRLDQVTDRLLVFANGRRPRVALPRTRDTPTAQAYIDRRFTGREPDGRRYMTAPLSSPNPRENLRYEYEGHTPPPNGWAISRDKMAAWHAAGRLHFVPGGRIYRKVYLDEYPGQPVPDLWTDIPVLNAMAGERAGYPTQKPEALLRRIVRMFTEPGEVVLDGFAGSGTAAAVARAEGRRVLAVDATAEAADRTFLRLARIPGPPLHRDDLAAAPDPPVGATATLRDGALRDIDVPDLAAALAERGHPPATPVAMLTAVAWGTRRDGVLHISHLDAPDDGAQLVGLARPDGAGPDARLWDLRHRALDATHGGSISSADRAPAVQAQALSRPSADGRT